jgi:hypothetical protein
VISNRQRAGGGTVLPRSAPSKVIADGSQTPPLERTGFELAVPLRWTALWSEVVEEAFGLARYDERGSPQRPGVSACSTP